MDAAVTLAPLPGVPEAGTELDALGHTEHAHAQHVSTKAADMMASRGRLQTFVQGQSLVELRDKKHRVGSLFALYEEADQSCCGCIGGTLDPDSGKRYIWDFFLVFLLLYVAVAIPIRLAFDQTVALGSAEFYIDMLVDIFFLIDIVLNFRTAIISYNEAGQRTRNNDRCDIAKHYLKGWFVIDIVAVLPYSYVELLADKGNDKNGSTQALFKALRLVRLAKLLRLGKMLPLLRRLDNKFDGLLSSAKLMSTMLTVVYITHVVGCMWYAVGNSSETLKDGSTVDGWVIGAGWGPEVTTFHRWLRAFYWAMTTLTTVGYGDVSPTTTIEMVFGVLAELGGTIVFGTLVGTVGSILAERRRLVAKHESEINELKEFMHAKSLPVGLQKKVQSYLGLLFKQDRSFDEAAIMNRLPPKLCFEMIHHLYGDKLVNVPVFSNLPEEVLFELCGMLLPYPAAKGEFVYRIGEHAREIFVINQGEVIVTTCPDDGTMTEEEIVAGDPDARVMVANSVFGVEALDFEDLVEVHRTHNAITTIDVQMSMLRVAAVEELAKKYPVLRAQIELVVAERASNQTLEAEVTQVLQPEGAPSNAHNSPAGHAQLLAMMTAQHATLMQEMTIMKAKMHEIQLAHPSTRQLVGP